jgi:hypothetical protein
VVFFARTTFFFGAGGVSMITGMLTAGAISCVDVLVAFLATVFFAAVFLTAVFLAAVFLAAVFFAARLRAAGASPSVPCGMGT